MIQLGCNANTPGTAGRIAMVPTRARQKHSASTGGHGHRNYPWAWITLRPEDAADAGPAIHHRLFGGNASAGPDAALRPP
jgi:hypothetical protein